MIAAFQTPPHPKCGTPTNGHVYRNETGKPVLVANRYEKPTGGKFFLPFDVIAGEWKAPQSRPIYNLDKITQSDPATPIILVEGEKCADALADLGFLTTTTFGGSNGSAKTDLSPFANRHVVIWPDYDEAGKKYAKAIITALSKQPNVTISELFICPETFERARISDKKIRLYAGWDAADAIEGGWSKEDVTLLLNTASSDKLAVPESHGKSSKVAVIHEISELWRTPQNETFATLAI